MDVMLYEHFAVVATYEVCQEDVFAAFAQLLNSLGINIIHHNLQCRLDFKCRTDWRHLVYETIETNFSGFSEKWLML
jgi:hypothetical protein